MSVVGQSLQNFSIPVCTKFTPTVVKDQHCYQVDLNQFKSEVDLKKIMSHGLTLLLDYNEDRQVQDRVKTSDAVQVKDLEDMRYKDDSNHGATIHIETIGMHTLMIIE